MELFKSIVLSLAQKVLLCSQSVDEERNQDYSYLGYFRLFLNKNKLNSELLKFWKKNNKCVTRDVAILKNFEKRLMFIIVNKAIYLLSAIGQ